MRILIFTLASICIFSAATSSYALERKHDKSRNWQERKEQKHKSYRRSNRDKRIRETPASFIRPSPLPQYRTYVPGPEPLMPIETKVRTKTSHHRNQESIYEGRRYRTNMRVEGETIIYDYDYPDYDYDYPEYPDYYYSEPTYREEKEREERLKPGESRWKRM